MIFYPPNGYPAPRASRLRTRLYGNQLVLANVGVRPQLQREA